MRHFKHIHAVRTALLFSGALAFAPLARSAYGTVDGCTAAAGTITTDSTQQCLLSGSATLVAFPGGDAVIPPGYQLGYILTSTNGLHIEQVGPDPVFTVSGVNIWRIHSIVYDPNTLDFAAILDLDHLYQLQDLLVQGGGSICASLNTGGAGTKTTTCENTCTANAGSISALNPDQCLVEGEAQLEATPDGNANVPDGFSVLHVLTSGPDLIILAVGVEPSFTVNAAGPFAIHTLVYDPATLDLSGIVFGETSAFEIVALLQQGGGPVCGSLDATGAQFQVADCAPVCEAFAGTLTPVASEVCLVDGNAELDAVPNSDAVVPDGYSIAYILARANGIIENVEPVTLFAWPLTGEYVIHTLVYDPFTLDPFQVVLGVTTVDGINASLIQGGGTICGSLDLTGAQFTVIECGTPCDADAGADANVVLCTDRPPLALGTLLNGDAGGVWTDPANQPFSGSFNPATDVAGAYIYIVGATEECAGDSAIVTVTLTTAPDAGVSSLIEVCDSGAPFSCIAALGGDPETNGTWTGPNGAPFSGSFNPAIDLPGVYTYVVAGTAPCQSSSATLMIIVQNCCTAGESAEITVCFTDPPILLFDLLGGDPCTSGAWTTPDGQAFSGVLNPSTDASGIYTYTVPGDPGQPPFTAALTVNVIECANPCIGAAGEDVTVELCDNGSLYELFPLLGGSPVAGGSWFSTAFNEPFFDGFYDSMIDQGGVFGYVASGGPDCDPDTAYVTVVEFQCLGPCATSSPDAGIGGDVVRCDVDPPTELFDLLLGTPDAGGTWTGPTGDPFPGLFSPLSDAPGVYVYTVFDLPDCLPDTTQLNVMVVPCDGPQQAAHPERTDGAPITSSAVVKPAVFMLWPDPATDITRFESTAPVTNAARIDLTDMLGRSFMAPMNVSGTRVTIDVSALPAGSYSVRVIDGVNSGTGRFMRARD